VVEEKEEVEEEEVEEEGRGVKGREEGAGP